MSTAPIPAADAVATYELTDVQRKRSCIAGSVSHHGASRSSSVDDAGDAFGLEHGVDLRGVARVGADPLPEHQHEERQVEQFGHAPQDRAGDLLIVQRTGRPRVDRAHVEVGRRQRPVQAQRDARHGVEHELERTDREREARPAATTASRRSRPAAGRSARRRHRTTSCSIQPNTGTSIAQRGNGPKNSTTDSSGTSGRPDQRVASTRANARAQERAPTATPAGARRSGPPASTISGTTSNSAELSATSTPRTARPGRRREPARRPHQERQPDANSAMRPAGQAGSPANGRARTSRRAATAATSASGCQSTASSGRDERRQGGGTIVTDRPCDALR